MRQLAISATAVALVVLVLAAGFALGVTWERRQDPAHLQITTHTAPGGWGGLGP